jgi:GNAT superfamily N-acetyltransferase
MSPARASRSARVRVAPLVHHPAAVPIVASWLHAQWFAAWGRTPAQCEADLRERLQAAALPIAFVALAGQVPVGTASLDVDEHPLDGHAICALSCVCVPPAWRGLGVGRALCAHVAAWGAARGHPTLGLFTRDAAAWYERLGWALVAHVPVADPGGCVLGAYLEGPVRAACGRARAPAPDPAIRPGAMPA